MLKAAGYDIQQIIYEDPAITVCHALSMEDRRDVLLKMVKEGPRAIVENAKVINEYEVAGSLDFPGILKPLALIRDGNRLIMASEWLYGLTLKHLALSKPLNVPDFLQIAIDITHVLEKLHKENIIHMNIRPETIVVVPSTLQVCLTGFGHSIYIIEEKRQTKSIPLIEGSPPYMAPERSGQLDGSIEPGTDLYSLGITLYEVLAGKLPFAAKDPLEWAHAHVARAPMPFDSISSTIPLIIQQIIFKLLEKSVVSRYRSAAGLRKDLEECLTQYKQKGRIDPFELGQGEHPSPSNKLTSLSANDGMSLGSQGMDEGVEESTGSYAQVLEMEALIRASQAFAEEKDSFKLMSRIMLIIMKVSGAHKGALVKCAGDEWHTVLMSDLDKSSSLWAGSIPLDECGDLSPAVVRNVAINRGPVILNDAKDDLSYANDAYLKMQRPKSVLGLPVSIQGDLQGVLYLENHYTSGVFSTDRLSLLQMLASQLGYVHTLTGYFEPSGKKADTAPESIPSLTNREIDVLQCLSIGLSNKEIADRLIMSPGTVKVHVRNVFDKLGVNNRVKAVAMAVKLNLLNHSDSAAKSGTR